MPILSSDKEYTRQLGWFLRDCPLEDVTIVDLAFPPEDEDWKGEERAARLYAQENAPLLLLLPACDVTLPTSRAGLEGKIFLRGRDEDKLRLFILSLKPSNKHDDDAARSPNGSAGAKGGPK